MANKVCETSPEFEMVCDGCGNFIVEGAEYCDDSLDILLCLDDCSACDSTATRNPNTKVCFLKSLCGNGILDTNEYCDDGPGGTCYDDCTDQCPGGYLASYTTNGCFLIASSVFRQAFEHTVCLRVADNHNTRIGKFTNDAYDEASDKRQVFELTACALPADINCIAVMRVFLPKFVRAIPAVGNDTYILHQLPQGIGVYLGWYGHHFRH